MPKKLNETYQEYKKRIIDPISKSFCAAKWLNATIWLNSGTTASCHHPPAHKIDINEIKRNPSAIHNTLHKKLMRKQMLDGNRPNECDYCWRIEDIGRDNISDRVFKTIIYDDSTIEKLTTTPWDYDVNLETLEISFDRTCNFACSYCNASFSTTWGNDIKKFGPYQNMVSDGAAAFQQDGSWSQPYKQDENNPYIEAFWKWWPQLSQSLKELRITGGEPLMSADVWKLFDFFENNKLNMKFSVNSNLGAKQELIERLIDKSFSINHFDLYTSCEAYGSQAEYIRDGLDFNYWTNNCISILEKSNVKGFHIMMTINSLCLFSITDLMELILKWKEKYGKRRISWSVNILRFPSFMSPLALPDHIKNDRREHIKSWIEKNKNNSLIHEHEYEGILRLIDYLEVVDAPHRRVSSKMTLWRDFKSFYKQYDIRRKKNIHNTFPVLLTEWMDNIPDTNLEVRQALVDGDSTQQWDGDSELASLAEKEGWIINPESSNPDSVK